MTSPAVSPSGPQSESLPQVAETLKHPAFAGTIWKLEPHSKGRCPVAKGRGGPLQIAYELHGDGPIRVAFIMGLAGVKTSWQQQTKYFGHDLGDKYTVLILDNRGIGQSDKPWRRYTTSAMALDAIEVLEHVGWLDPPYSSSSTSSAPADSSPAAAAATASRAFHLVGISMGGMISQEIAYRIPTRLASLSLICTAAVVENTKSCTPRCGRASTPAQDGAYLPFDSNFQRFQAQELVKKLNPATYTAWGFALQLGAAMVHNKSQAQLSEIADKLGRERILIIHGDADEMIDVSLGKKLIDMVKPGTSQIIPGMGHAPIMDRGPWLNELLETHIAAGEKIKESQG
ncbi:unnamed protein product [Parascedosporium putredinis]|uniref:AB hydrolase-1 domain-containing protein n=1 Tax=Parascedosporium putredinis TaxID=1442378 RepID=A0A9P1HCS8_9PEZI|nr:unnamed protein product [Parascedosporium putredinis]CAI8003340.1 unnamed protein product [Parascedosporium putredinis]